MTYFATTFVTNLFYMTCREAFRVVKAPRTNLAQAGRLLGAGCRRALELLLYVRHKVGARPRGVVPLA